MARRFKITEEQRKYALSEGITINADVQAANGDVKKAVDNARKDAQNSGVNPNKVNINIPANENKVRAMRSVAEQRLRSSKANSTVYSVRDFMSKVKR